MYVGPGGRPGRLIYESVAARWARPRVDDIPRRAVHRWSRSLCLRHSEHGDMLHFGLRVLRATTASTIGDLVDDGHTVRVGGLVARCAATTASP